MYKKCVLAILHAILHSSPYCTAVQTHTVALVMDRRPDLKITPVTYHDHEHMLLVFVQVVEADCEWAGL